MKYDFKKGYTLVEMLIVMSIIGVLMAMLITGAQTARTRSQKAKALRQMDAIITALEMYREDFLAYPPDDTINGIGSYSSSQCLYFYLGATFVKGQNSSINAGPYMQFQGNEITLNGGGGDFNGDGVAGDVLYDLVDIWKNPIEYDSDSPSFNTESYDLLSLGVNGTSNSGGGDDICNW
ncbi:MAG: prepilin-type N-terminal cleavage/methylation domain-containing protein [Candidatus Theseobacter exili]|nr:prepilin-type N-terminal cleavage/methylation domain-containing protein [Candidatus Theseobacter exili]